MTCHYCVLEEESGRGTGLCSVCQKLVCFNPSGRPDDKFHGATCRCDCDRSVCIYHIDRHFELFHPDGDTSTCFAELTSNRALPVLTDALFLATESGHERSRGRKREKRSMSDERRGGFNEFLNFITPRFAALHGAMGKLPGAGHDVPATYVSPTEDVRVLVFDAEFFTESALERLIILSAGTLLESWRRTPESTRSVRLPWIDDAVAGALDSAMPLWLRKRKVSPKLLEPLLPAGAHIPQRLQIALDDVPVPPRDSQAAWLLQAAMPEHALLAREEMVY